MKSCEACGRGLADQDRFCPSCGRPVTGEGAAPEPQDIHDEATATTAAAGSPLSPMAPDTTGLPAAPSPAVPQPQPAVPSPAARPPMASAPRRRTSWLVPLIVFIVVVAAAAAGIWYVQHQKTTDAADEKAAAATALKPFQKLDSSLTVGLTFDDYSTLVGDAQYGLDAYSPSDSRGQQIRTHLATAMSAYKAAHDAWNDDIQGDFKGNRENGKYWIKQCPELADQFITEYLVTASEVEQAGWAVAQEQLAASKSLLAEYQVGE